MVLGFKTQFVKSILQGIKKHTIRTDATGRWHAGNSIQMATGVRTKAYKQFNANKPKLQSCISTQAIQIKHHKCYVAGKCFEGPSVHIDGRSLTALEIHDLAINDGFNNKDHFFEWFNTDYTGKIIHWTNLKY
jgi:hypothetical protein